MDVLSAVDRFLGGYLAGCCSFLLVGDVFCFPSCGVSFYCLFMFRLPRLSDVLCLVWHLHRVSLCNLRLNGSTPALLYKEKKVTSYYIKVL